LKSYSANDITVLIRDESKRSLFTDLNVVVGDNTDPSLIRSLAVEHDVILNFAVPFGGGDASIQAMVDGLEERAKTSPIKPVLLETSGSGSVLYGSDGNAGTNVWRVGHFSHSIGPQLILYRTPTTTSGRSCQILPTFTREIGCRLDPLDIVRLLTINQYC
jgi:hypothetical protein